MSQDFEDDEIVQDFLVESREILESLGEQLVELEQNGDDADLLNSVFRGFHTIKGGAGFLGLDPLVAICHRTEDLFNLLRNGQRVITPELMDCVLRALDVVNSQFDALAAGEDLPEASASLLDALEQLVEHGEVGPPGEALSADEQAADEPDSGADQERNDPDALEAAFAAAGNAPADKPATPASADITDDEFEALLDSLEATSGKETGQQAKGKAAKPGQAAKVTQATQAGKASGGDDPISDDEFESLLDDLHGKGRHGNAPPPSAGAPDSGAGKSAGQSGGQSGGGNNDHMTDDEFEGLLDQLQYDQGGIAATAPRAVKASKTATDTASAPAAKPPATAPAAVNPPAARPGSAAAEPGGAQPGRGAAAQAETSVRVDTARLDDIMNLVGELVLVRNRLMTQTEKLGNEQVGLTVADLELVTADLQAAVMKTRMQPIKKVYGRFPRLVRDLARDLGKDIALEMHGEDTDLDKNLVEAIADPLIHLVRNSCDHGIESPEVRKAAGKPAQGKLLLSAAQEGDRILLVIADDGGGMDPEKLKRIAVSKGVIDEEAAARLDDRECFNLIFLPGFSTKEEISDVSGRGVGMDVVRTRIAQLNGTIEIESKMGVGTTLKVRVPLTLAILPTLMVRIGGRKFAMPMSVVSEIFALDETQTRVVDGRKVVLVRKKAMPLYYLERWINSIHRPGLNTGTPAEDPLDDQQQVVSVVLGHQPIGLIVDEVIGLEEVVIKPLGSMLHGLPGLAGSTTTGDGRIALIIDIPSLIKSCGGSM